MEVGDTAHARLTPGIGNEQLARDHIGCTEIGDLLPPARDGGAQGKAVIAVIETGEDAVEVAALVGELTVATEYLGNAHQRAGLPVPSAECRRG